jgi:hypothetical protein
MEKFRLIDGQKFVWDGVEYATPGDAARARAEYEQEGFTVKQVLNSEKPYLFTRRVVKEVVTSG